MSINRRAAKRDASEGEVILTLRNCGWRVLQINVKDGPDLLAAKGGRTVLIEVKTGKQQLRPGQAAWQAAWPAPVYVVRTVDDALALAAEAGAG